MSEDRPTGGPSWLERLGHALLGEPRDRQELIELLRDAEQRHLLDPDVLAMVEGAFQVSEMQVRDVMVPRAQMVVVERDAPFEETLRAVIESGHSRFPVVGDDWIIGPGVEELRDHPGLGRHLVRAGRQIHVWTVNTAEDLDVCLDLGVTAVITDRPKHMLELLGVS